MLRDGQRMGIEFVATAAEIPESLWRECFPPPLEGFFWYRTLEASGLGDQFEFRYAVIKAAGRAMGIAPCFTHNVPIALVAPRPVALALKFLSRLFPRVGYQRTFFVGSPCSDEGSVGLVPGVVLADVIGELSRAVQAEARRQRSPLVVFKDFPQPALAALGRADGFFPMVSYPGTMVPLPGPDKQAYLQALSHKRRHNFLKKLRRSQELLPLETSVVARPSDRELEEIFGLFSQTYEKGRIKFEKLDRRFFHKIREQEAASFLLQRDGKTGELLAFMLVLCLGERVINKFIGLDYRRGSKAHLYFRLFEAALDFAYARQAKELQSGQTGYQAKLDLGHRLVPLFNVIRHANPLMNAFYRALGARVSWKTLDDDLANYLRGHPEASSAAAGPSTHRH